MPDQLQLSIDDDGPLRSLWEGVLDNCQKRIGREAVESWLRDTEVVSLADGCLTISAPNATARTWIEKKYTAVLQDALADLQGETIKVTIETRRAVSRPVRAERQSSSRPLPPTRPAPSALFSPIPLNEKYEFENFIVGQSNRFAYAAASAVADQPGREYNPLFIYGGVGLGKTHLLQAIGHHIRKRDPNIRVAYVSGETFTSHFITSLREHREEEFRRAYRSIDIWLVDDIQFIADKTSTKEEFFHTFNELYLTNRQIVLASDRPPRELRLMEDRLRTRLESGLMVEIGPPELETRIAILEKRAQMEGATVPPDVLYQIARAVTQNVRVLEAALIRMLALGSLSGCPMSSDLAARAVGAFVQDGRLTAISLLAIQKAVCDYFKVSPELLTSPRRDRATCMARQVAMYLMRELTRKSLMEIGEAFGGKAHSTVLYACEKLEKEMKADAGLEAAVRELRQQLAGPPPGG